MKAYHYEIPLNSKTIVSDDFKTLSDCINACQAECKALGIDYDSPEVKVYMVIGSRALEMMK